jgi:beta-lactamase regulating signal transducer with metallopeptidase domain
MNFLLMHGTALFLSVLHISWQASVLAVLVLATQYLFRRQLSLRWRHALWLLVLARLVLPILPASPFSIDRFTSPPSLIESMPGSTEGDARLVPSVGSTQAVAWMVEGIHVATLLWLTGAGMLTVVTLVANGRFVWALRFAPPCRDPGILDLVQSCARELGFRRTIPVIETPLVGSPAIFGLFRARLLVPEGLIRDLNRDELQLIFLHEIAHLRRADMYQNALLSVLQIVHWFNPLLWFVFARIVHDREMATDAMVLSGPRASLKTLYGHTLIKLIDASPSRGFAPQLVGIMGIPSRLKDRLLRIRQATPDAYGWSVWGLALLGVIGVMSLTRSYDDVRTLIYRAETLSEIWDGWGPAPAPDPTQDTMAPPTPEQFTLVENDGSAPRVFSGKVVVPGLMDGVEVGLVSLVGVHWVNKDAYQWEPVAVDGTFSLTDSHYPEAPKALAVRGPDTPWTFLRYNFAPDESATDIVLKGAPPVRLRLTASGEDQEDLSSVNYEIFPAYAQYDDQGRVLRRQRLGSFNSGENKFVDALVPPGEIALFVRHDGFSAFYQIIDTRKADHVHFVLIPAGGMKISVVDRDGKPESGLRVQWANPAAPLSLSGSATGADGVLRQGNLTPGTIELNVDGFAPKEITVDEGQVTELHLQEGVDP